MSRLKLGLHLPSAGPGAEASSILEVARAAEKHGYDSVWMFDHLFTPIDLESKYPYGKDGAYPMSPEHPFFDPLGLIGVLAGATSRIQIGTAVMVAAYRHPIVMGKALASIERFAPGRILLGLGAGWMDEEFRAVGLDPAKKGARLDEHIRALRAIWSGAPASFTGDFYSFPLSGFLPAPTAPIPILVGGHGDPALRRAAALGDGWAIVTGKGQGSGLDAVAARLDVLRGFREEAKTADRPYHLLYQNPLFFAEAPNPKMPLSGPPQAIAETLVRLRGMGVTTVNVTVYGPPSMIVETAQRVAEEVRPLVDRA
jgi:probable F420-dependent oxidoreductase